MTAPRKLRAWQEECIEKLIADCWPRKRRALVTATPGAGKTTLALTFAQNRIRAGEIDHVHVVAPTRALRRHWQDAAREFGINLTRRSNAKIRLADLPDLRRGQEEGLGGAHTHLTGWPRDLARSGVGVGALEYRSGTGHGCEPGNRTQSRASGLRAVVHLPPRRRLSADGDRPLDREA